MTRNTDIAANLLRNAANFFRGVGEQNPALAEEMKINAESYDAVADLLEKDPTGSVELAAGDTTT